MENVAVVGGAGFVGRHIVAALAEDGRYRVRSADIIPVSQRAAAGPLLSDSGESRIEHVVADITSAEACRDIISGCSTVFHTAAILSMGVSANPVAGFRLNVIGAWNITQACASAGAKLILSSSVGVYGRPPAGAVDESTPFWHTDAPYGTASYGAAKILAEYNARLLAEHHSNFRWIGLRYSSVYGHGQHAQGRHTREFLENFDRVIAGEAPLITGLPEKLNDYLHVRDAARANICALHAPDSAWGQSYTIGSGYVITSLELARTVAAFGDRHLDPRIVPSKGETWVGPRYDLSKAEKGLGFKAAVSLQSGLREIFEARKAAHKLEVK